MASDEILLIFGVTGLTGKPLVRAALQKNLRVKLFVRNSDKIPGSVRYNRKVEIVKGEFTDLEAVAKACKGVTYVISVVGDKTLSKDRFMLKMATAIAEATAVVLNPDVAKYACYQEHCSRTREIN